MKPKVRIITTDAEIDAIIAQGKIYDQYRPKAVAARYCQEADTIVITMATGVEIVIPRKLMQGLENATPAQIAKVKVEDFGSALARLGDRNFNDSALGAPHHDEILRKKLRKHMQE